MSESSAAAAAMRHTTHNNSTHGLHCTVQFVRGLVVIRVGGGLPGGECVCACVMTSTDAATMRKKTTPHMAFTALRSSCRVSSCSEIEEEGGEGERGRLRVSQHSCCHNTSLVIHQQMLLQDVAGSCSVLQCVAVCCRVLHCAAVCCSVLQCCDSSADAAAMCTVC